MTPVSDEGKISARMELRRAGLYVAFLVKKKKKE